MSKFIITYTPCFKTNMIKELIKIDSNINVERVFSDGMLLINSSLDVNDFMDLVIQLSPIFIKHLMPVIAQGKITEDETIDKNEMFSKIQNIITLKNGSSFSVQCRIVSGGKNGLNYNSKDIEVHIGQYYENMGNTPIFSDKSLTNEDVMVISVFINTDDYYLGYSSSKQNLNFHCDEYRTFSRNGREISRAENKLKEALSKFNILLSGDGYALDIGASPGGWTKVLADYGYNVIAVDPGDLKKELQNHPRIKHYKCRIEDLKFNNFFDIIVNDMNIDPQVTGQIMNNLANTLKDEGLAIVTLKLPDKVEEAIEETIAILDSCYDVLTIKSLFHNRQEVTTLLKRKSLIENR